MCLGKVSAAVPLQKQVFEGPGQSVADSFCIARVTSFHSAGWTVYACTRLCYRTAGEA